MCLLHDGAVLLLLFNVNYRLIDRFYETKTSR